MLGHKHPTKTRVPCDRAAVRPCIRRATVRALTGARSRAQARARKILPPRLLCHASCRPPKIRGRPKFACIVQAVKGGGAAEPAAAASLGDAAAEAKTEEREEDDDSEDEDASESERDGAPKRPLKA